MNYRLKVNGAVHSVEADPSTPLLWILREQLGLTGTKYSCGIGECGACTVLVDGQAFASCTLTAEEVVDQEITTIEGLQGHVAEALFKAWHEGDVPQCGYCQPGQIMQAAALLLNNPKPDDAQIEQAMANVLCRCGTYPDIRKALSRVIEEINS